MPIKVIPVIECSEDFLLAEDIRTSYGAILAARYTEMTEDLKSKFISLGILTVRVYYFNGDKVKNAKASYEEVKTNYNKNRKYYMDLVHDISAGRKIEYEKILGISELIHSDINEISNLIRCLSEIQNADEYTYTHSINTAVYCMLIAKWMGLDDRDIKIAIQSGLLHDIGKSKVPEAILNKKGKLTEEEFSIMKKHTIYGLEILNNIDDIDPEVKRVAVMHHERIDGSGYPYNTSDQFISLFAKITSIADVYDAITSARVYREKNTPFNAFFILKTEGMCKLDTTALNTFLDNIGHYYIGFNVLLNNGKIGKVVHIPIHAPDRPIIEVNEEYIDLSQNKSLEILEVIQSE